MIFDTHCHYNLAPLYESWPDAWAAAQAKGITHSAVIGTDVVTSQRALEIAATDPNLLAVIGIHPSELQELVELHPEDELETRVSELTQSLKELSNSAPIQGVGETGLDYFRLPSDVVVRERIKQLQALAFKNHIQLALEKQVPVIIHVRDTGEAAYWDVLRILNKYPVQDLRFILHCISGPLEYLRQAVALGAYVGVAGNVTYQNADHIRSLIAMTPPDRVLLETDAPYLPPVPHRGEVCQPSMIHLTATYLEEELGMSLSQIYSTSLKLFGV